jgi:integrase
MQAKITKRTVDAAKPEKRDAFWWDPEIKGFGLKVTPADKKVYILQYRMGGRRAPVRRYTIGNHGDPWTPEKAREEAKRLVGAIAEETDPGRLKAEERSGLTIAELCDQYFSAAPSLILPKKGRPKKASSLAIDRSNIERHVKPLLGRKRVRDLTRADVERFQNDVATGKTAKHISAKKALASGEAKPRGRIRVTGGKGTAARATAVLGSIFSYAVREGICDSNPVRGVTLLKTNERERYLTAAELKRLGETLSAAERNGESATVTNAIRLLVLTGCRKSEILGLRWDWVDIERGRLLLPDSKTDKRIVTVGAPALQLLAALPREKDNPYVLPGAVKDKHLVGLPKAWKRIRALAGLSDVRLHDLRHTFASIAVASGESLYLTGKLLGHREARTTQKYAHVKDDPLRAAADRNANTIAAAMEGKSAEIVPLTSRTA